MQICNTYGQLRIKILWFTNTSAIHSNAENERKKEISSILISNYHFSFFQVFCEYFKELEEESIRDNFVIIYELLDELMDFGYPQTTDSKILQE